jgi:hypothetical protein
VHSEEGFLADTYAVGDNGVLEEDTERVFVVLRSAQRATEVYAEPFSNNRWILRLDDETNLN